MVVNSLHTVAVSRDRQDLPPVPTKVDLVRANELTRITAQSNFSPLAIVHYGDVERQTAVANTLNVHVELPQLGEHPLLEVWTSTSAVTTGQWQQFQYAHNEDCLFAMLELQDPDDEELEQVAQDHYQNLLEMINQLGFPHLIRMWNYFPAMNSEPDGLERYKRFCVGRHRAFSKMTAEFQKILPAASAIGSQSGTHFLVYFIASRAPGMQVENPRQVSAFCYPEKYGPSSPSFSRAIYIPWQNGEQLYLSGTASVVGHDTVHIDETENQLRETIANIESLCEHAGHTMHTSLGKTQLEGTKVYIRHAKDYALIRKRLEQYLGSDAPVLYLLGDICRQDLLLEIEGLFSRLT